MARTTTTPPSGAHAPTRCGVVVPWPVLVLAIALLPNGCTTLQTSELPPDSIREGIRDGYLVKVGDKIGVVTEDGTEQELTVQAVGPETIRGESSAGDVAILIDDVVALQTPQLEIVRTSFLALGSTAVLSIGATFLMLLLLT